MKVYKLKVPFNDWPIGTTMLLDTEWSEWDVNGATYGYRGSIHEGAIANTLMYMATKQSSLLSPYPEEEPEE